jgi:hypothetical protein
MLSEAMENFLDMLLMFGGVIRIDDTGGRRWFTEPVNCD